MLRGAYYASQNHETSICGYSIKLTRRTIFIIIDIPCSLSLCIPQFIIATGRVLCRNFSLGGGGGSFRGGGCAMEKG